MRKTLYIIVAMLFAIAFEACDTKDNFIDTGISNGRYDGNMMEYFASNSYDWDSTVLVIQRAGLENIFTGNDPDHKEITFLGPTNHSIRRYMLQNNYKTVNDISVDYCRDMILKHIVDGKYMKEDIAFRNMDYTAASPLQNGGTTLTTLGGNILLAYREREDYAGVSEAGPIVLRLFTKTLQQKVPIASPNIECDNGVVHSLNYTYTFGQI